MSNESALERAAAASGWLFDFDNTLAHLEPYVDWAASRRELEAFLRGHHAPADLFERFPSGNLLLFDALRNRLPPGRIREVLAGASAIIEKYELAGAEQAPPFEGAAKLLRGLHSRQRMVAIVTSNSSRTVMRWLDRHRLGDLVDAIVGRDSGLPLKPAPQMLERALAVCHLEAAQAVMIGDSEADRDAAAAAGVAYLAIAHAPRKRGSTAAAAPVFPSLTALGGRLGLFPSAAGDARLDRTQN